jgi:hypothetical protein
MSLGGAASGAADPDAVPECGFAEPGKLPHLIQ